jgi:lysophospholipase L1-like esterase
MPLGEFGRVARTSLAATAFVLLALTAGSGSASGAQPRRAYIAMGASVTSGVGASSPNKSYVQQYYGYLQQTAGLTDVYTMARPGWTSTELRNNRLTSAVNVINDPASDTTNITMDIGFNDLYVDSNCPTANAPACPFSANLRAILEALNSALANDPGDETVQAMEFYNPDIGTANESATRQLLLGTDGRIDCSGTGGALGLNDLTHCISIEKGARTIDVLPTFDAAGAAYFDTDHVHPNDAGHLAIARAFGGAATPSPPPPPAPPRLRASKPKVSRAIAGRQLTASMIVTNVTAGKKVKSQVSCQGKLSGKSLRASGRSSSSSGRAACTWRLPRTARGKLFRGSITSRFQGAKVSRSFSAKVK